ncbi:MAG: hypothetical protein KatS3mg082_2418 [Nitrospiraceae bacterium]|nr:MAG: hypothetical protein KatS3mg082_2418 [Nitrospiraceae bacterium]
MLNAKSFIRDAGNIILGTTAGQAINFLSALAIGRIYAPEHFGIFAIFSAICWILVVLSTLQYEHLIVQRKNDHIRCATLYFSLLYELLFFILTYIVVIVIYIIYEDSLIVQGTNLFPYYLYIPITVFLIAINQALRYYNIALANFKYIGLSVALTALLSGGGAVLLGLTNPIAESLIIAQVAGYAGGNAVLLMPSSRSLRRKEVAFRSIVRIGLALFPSASRLTAAYASRTIYSRLPTFILAAAGNGDVVGQYALVERILSAPTAIAGRGFSDVFRERFASAWNRGMPLSPLIRRAIVGAAGFAFPACLIGAALAPIVFQIAFGDEWDLAGHIARLLIISEGFIFVGTIIESAAVIMRFEKYLIMWHSSRTIFKIALLFFVLHFRPTPMQIISIIVAQRVIFYVIDMFVIYRRALKIS